MLCYACHGSGEGWVCFDIKAETEHVLCPSCFGSGQTRPAKEVPVVNFKRALREAIRAFEQFNPKKGIHRG